MIRVTIQTPAETDNVIVAKLERAAQELFGKGGEIVWKHGAAPAETYGMTVHELPDPEQPGELEE